MVRRKPKSQRRKGNRGRQQQQPQRNPPPAQVTYMPEVVKVVQPDVPNGRADQQHTGEQPRREWLRLDRWFGVVLMIAAVAQAIYAARQWSTMEKQTAQTQDMLDQMWLEQRPWVSIDDPKISVVAGTRLECGFRMGNMGHTPAKLETLAYKIFTADKDESIDPELTSAETWSTNRKEGFDIPAGQATEKKLVGQDIGKVKIRKIESGEKLLYMAVSLTYSGVRGPRYKTSRSFVYDHTQKSFVHRGGYDRMD